MMCHSTGRFPMGTIGLGRYSVSSRSRVPLPPQRITVFMRGKLSMELSDVSDATRPIQPSCIAFASKFIEREEGRFSALERVQFAAPSPAFSGELEAEEE